MIRILFYFSALDTEDNGLVDSSLSTILQLKSSPSEAIESTLGGILKKELTPWLTESAI